MHSKEKTQLEEFFQVYKEVFQEPKMLLPKREVGHETQLLHDSPLLNIGLYRHAILELDV